jgi:hypothetical protein
MFAPSVLVDRATEPTSAWIEASADVAAPPIGGGSDASFTQWAARRSPTTGETLLLGCVATPIPGWVEDMRLAVDTRTVGLMNASAARVTGVPVEARDATGHFSLRPVGAPEGAARLGIARTFVGWNEHEVVTCFAVCATRLDAAAPAAARPGACDRAVLTARLDGSRPPPPAGLALGTVTWAVHHPSTTIRWGAVVVLTLGAAAVVSRRRPRSRI